MINRVSKDTVRLLTSENSNSFSSQCDRKLPIVCIEGPMDMPTNANSYISLGNAKSFMNAINEVVTISQDEKKIYLFIFC